jgi:hypothetical protein
MASNNEICRMSAYLDDAAVLQASAAYEAASPWAGQWPPLLEQLGL